MHGRWRTSLRTRLRLGTMPTLPQGSCSVVLVPLIRRINSVPLSEPFEANGIGRFDALHSPLEGFKGSLNRITAFPSRTV